MTTRAFHTILAIGVLSLVFSLRGFRLQAESSLSVSRGFRLQAESSLSVSRGFRLQAEVQDAPKILLDQPLRAVEYQLDRLSNDELVRVERRPEDIRYRPVYVALLTRKGLARDVRAGALDALKAMDKASETQVLLAALGKVKADDGAVADQLLGLLFAQAADRLRGERDLFVKALETPASPFVLRGAYGALMIADGGPAESWKAASARDGHLVELLRSVPSLGKADAVRAQLFAPVSELIGKSEDPAIRAEAVAALGWTRRDTATFRLLAQEIVKGSDAGVRGAAIRALVGFPESAWPKGELEPLARSLVALVRDTETNRRTEAPAIDALQFGERLASALPAETGRAIRRDLRALGVRVVRIETIPEQMKFDLNWFAVEAGKPVQIVLVNPDAMPHNLLVSKPGSLQEVGTAAGSVPMSTDPKVKPFVPDTPLVLQATRLVQQGETEPLGFTAPKEPGEYVFLCSFPGHWLRMYGVMLVVPNLDAWESSPTIPIDPMTKKPFAAQR